MSAYGAPGQDEDPGLTARREEFHETLASVPMPSSVPPGMRLELLPARIRPGKEPRADEWMRMLNDRVQECRDTLGPERMAFEAQFRDTDADGTQWLYHLSLYGEPSPGLDETNPVDRAHADFSRECKEPGWQILQPELLLAPGPVISAMAQWAGSGHASEQE